MKNPQKCSPIYIRAVARHRTEQDLVKTLGWSMASGYDAKEGGNCAKSSHQHHRTHDECQIPRLVLSPTHGRCCRTRVHGVATIEPRSGIHTDVCPKKHTGTGIRFASVKVATRGLAFIRPNTTAFCAVHIFAPDAKATRPRARNPLTGQSEA